MGRIRTGLKIKETFCFSKVAQNFGKSPGNVVGRHAPSCGCRLLCVQLEQPGAKAKNRAKKWKFGNSDGGCVKREESHRNFWGTWWNEAEEWRCTKCGCRGRGMAERGVKYYLQRGKKRCVISFSNSSYFYPF